jgi:two-component system, NarL family, nitrate/nitrite response regulator NarL
MKAALTSRESEILVLLAEGQSNKCAAERLGISVRTVEGHRARLMLKLGLQSFAELVKYALRHLLIKP